MLKETQKDITETQLWE